ncbi:MAG: prolyl oligopeptidase family serine peptidase [Candidatus Omnitrophica bacterium]|nr:prolyl oligopeptidase family serine peptidase [Candidatus Omnitrophota bacterium]
MNNKKIAPYGSWYSSITSDMIVSQNIGFGQIVIDKQKNDIYWLESRPMEAGRNVIVQYNQATATVRDISPQLFNVRSKAHEYGGGAFTVDNQRVFFVNYQDQRIYKQIPGQEPRPITEQTDKRYADLIIDKKRNRLICVCEDHSNKQNKVKNYLISINLENNCLSVLTQGDDFYSSVKISPEADKLVWLSWNNPDMPWDQTKLSMADIQEPGMLTNIKVIAGLEPESIFQPQWLNNQDLCFVSDRNNWWNLYSYADEQITPIIEMQAEFGLAQWVFGMSTYAVIDSHNIICAINTKGNWQLAKLNILTKQLKIIKSEHCIIDAVAGLPGQAIFIAGTNNQFSSIVSLDIKQEKLSILKQSSDLQIDPGYLSQPQNISFKTSEDSLCHAFFYPPCNKEFSQESEIKPPLLVISHGGPTAAANAGLNLKIQYWTSRGFAVVDVNYTGSTGFGRKYRHKLYSQWGIADVNDCLKAAEFLVAHNLVDSNALAIRGGSAGGFTTLAALTFSNTFKTGASYYGVSDLISLTRETHKFEAHYLDKLIGPYPEAIELYKQRSPLNHIEQLNCPIIFFQGLEDKIVPPDQAEKMVAALDKKGIGFAYITFDQESHGFRKSQNIKKSLDWELYFYSQVFGFLLSDQNKPDDSWRLKHFLKST